MEGEEPPPEQAARSLHARFYRFLDDRGAVIKPPNPSDVGELEAATEAQLSLRKLPDTRQIGYIQSAGAIHEVIAVPIFSTDTGDLVSALVIGFKPFELENKNTGIQSGIWVDGHLHLPALAPSAQSSLNEKITPHSLILTQSKIIFAWKSLVRLSCCFISGSIRARCFRPHTKFFCILSPRGRHNCIVSAGKSAAPVRFCC